VNCLPLIQPSPTSVSPALARWGCPKTEIAEVPDFAGAPEEIRTPNPHIRSPILSKALTFLGFH
jgi:hypothetical protein